MSTTVDCSLFFCAGNIGKADPYYSGGTRQKLFDLVQVRPPLMRALHKTLQIVNLSAPTRHPLYWFLVARSGKTPTFPLWMAAWVASTRIACGRQSSASPPTAM